MTRGSSIVYKRPRLYGMKRTLLSNVESKINASNHTFQAAVPPCSVEKLRLYTTVPRVYSLVPTSCCRLHGEGSMLLEKCYPCFHLRHCHHPCDATCFASHLSTILNGRQERHRSQPSYQSFGRRSITTGDRRILVLNRTPF